MRKHGALKVLTESPLNMESSRRLLRRSLTPVSSFYMRNHFDIPHISLNRWSLSVEGEVSKPKVFTYRDLLRMRKTTQVVTMECAGNGRTGFPTAAEGEVRWGPGAVGTATWTGVPLREFLDACEPEPTAREVVFEGRDAGRVTGDSGTEETIRYTRSLPLGTALDQTTIVALRMNGQKLSPEHGYPARLIVPGWYGMASVKWLSKVTLRSGAPYHAHFNGKKYVYVTGSPGSERKEPVTTIRVKSVITRPLPGQRVVLGGKVRVEGKAWSGSGRIAKVEVDFGAGWKRAVLGRALGGLAWTSWRSEFVPERRGDVTISVRATDAQGNVQPESPLENKYQYAFNAIERLRVSVS